MKDYDLFINQRPLNNLGNFGLVFPINEDLVLKVPKRKWIFDYWYSTYNGYQVQRELYEKRIKGINVPKPEEGILKVLIDRKLADLFEIPQERKGFLMQRLYGKRLCEIPLGKRKNKYLEVHNYQISIARSLGFIPIDSNERSVFIEEGTEKVYLIDFDFWVKKN